MRTRPRSRDASSSPMRPPTPPGPRSAPGTPRPTCKASRNFGGRTELKGGDVCRICAEDASAGPLVRACACSGSLAAIHTACLERWIQLRREEDETEKLTCELCRTPYSASMERRFRCGRVKELSLNLKAALFIDTVLPTMAILVWVLIAVFGSQRFSTDTVVPLALVGLASGIALSAIMTWLTAPYWAKQLFDQHLVVHAGRLPASATQI